MLSCLIFLYLWQTSAETPKNWIGRNSISPSAIASRSSNSTKNFRRFQCCEHDDFYGQNFKPILWCTNDDCLRKRHQSNFEIFGGHKKYHRLHKIAMSFKSRWKWAPFEGPLSEQWNRTQAVQGRENWEEVLTIDTSTWCLIHHQYFGQESKKSPTCSTDKEKKSIVPTSPSTNCPTAGAPKFDNVRPN